jgi:dTDP-4-dehydrorhamnose 3,5-epimerase
MKFTETKLKGSFVIDLDVFSDERGWFARTYCEKEFASIGHDKEWVQMNHSFTLEKGAIRGMHFQVSEHKEIKLVRCIAGGVYDVIVDLRKNSPTFMQWIAAELSAQNKRMLYIPEGFAHGFQTLTGNTELIYHHSNFYNPKHERGVRYNDIQLKINWPLKATTISARDRNHPSIEKNFTGI